MDMDMRDRVTGTHNELTPKSLDGVTGDASPTPFWDLPPFGMERRFVMSSITHIHATRVRRGDEVINRHAARTIAMWRP
jgi:hypothetical protein